MKLKLATGKDYQRQQELADKLVPPEALNALERQLGPIPKARRPPQGARERARRLRQLARQQAGKGDAA